MIEQLLASLAAWLMRADVGLGIVILVGLSMAFSHLFALLANRLTPRQIAIQLLLDGLVLAVALLLASLVNMIMLGTFAHAQITPTALIDRMGPALLPGLLYVLVAAPYISDLIALTIWFLIHLNVVTLLHAHFGISYGTALLLATPGYSVALLLVIVLFHQSWQAGYRRLASELETLPQP